LQLLSKWTYKISLFFLAALLAVMTGVILLQVFAINLLNFSFIWSGELAQLCFVWLTFIGASAVYKKSEMIAFDMLIAKMQGKYRRWAAAFIQTVVIIFAVVFIYYGLEKALSPAVLIQKSTALKMPMIVPYISIPIGMFMLLIHAVADLLKTWQDKEVKPG
jgi:TRAP-type C4-dicarboxylate transport system permease small subunit